MSRPENVQEYKDLDLKLGIKSSLPNVKSTLALLIILWKACGKPSTLVYGYEVGDEIKIKQDVLEQVKSYLENTVQNTSDIEDVINSNQLLKSQLEALIVAFELIWRVAKIRFEDSAKPSSAERTGGKRFSKKLFFTSNMDIINIVIDGSQEEYKKVLAKWLGLNVSINPANENSLEMLLTALSEDALYKLSDGDKDVVFNQNEVYKKLKEAATVDINGDKEAKGSLRILKSLLSDGMNPFLKYVGGNVSMTDLPEEELASYQQRVDTYLSLSTKRIFLDEQTLDIEETENPEERNKRLFRYWMESLVKSDGDSDAGNPYSKTSIDQYVSNIASTKLANIPDKSVFYTTNIGEVEVTIELLDKSDAKNHTQKSAVKKYMEYLIEMEENNKEYEEILKHNLWGIHIKEQNDALSESNPHVCIGWSNMGDMTDLETTEDIMAVYEQAYEGKNNRAKGQDVGMIRRFLREVQVGDYVIFAESSVFHIGRIESDYYYDDTENPNQSPDYTNNRKVTWLKKDISRKVLSKAMHNSLGTAMSIFGINDYRAAVVDLLRGTYKKDEDSIDEVIDSISLNFKTDVEIGYERNRIVFGAPGTGKSFRLKADCEDKVMHDGAEFERVTFHPDYTYSQFVGTYKPVMDDDGEKIKYEYVPGPFMRVLVEALKSAMTPSPKPYILIIEEINRAKVAAVFGEVFQLLDRDEDGISEYEIQASEDIRRYLSEEIGGKAFDFTKLRIPNNMYIWATMNSADQGVFPMDTAFKRRWNFEYLGINENEDGIKGIGKIMLPGSDEPVEWNLLRRAINDKMSSSEFKINEDKLMGPYFLSKKVIASNENGMIIDSKKFVDAFKSKVLMYLYEDAVKQGKHRFFDGCDNSKYSSVCEAFDEKGTAIFGPTFRETYYDKQRDDA